MYGAKVSVNRRRGRLLKKCREDAKERFKDGIRKRRIREKYDLKKVLRVSDRG